MADGAGSGAAGAIWVHGETTADGGLARISTEVATLARSLGEAAGREVVGVVVAADPANAAAELARYVRRVVAVTEPATAKHAAGTIVGQRLAAMIERDRPSHLLTGAGPEGRDVAGVVSALTGWGVLVNALAVRWDDGPVVEMSVFGGKLTTTSRFTKANGIVTVRPNVVTAEPAANAGTVEPAAVNGELRLPQVPIVDRVAAESTAAPIEEARIIVSGGRGVGGPDGFSLVREIAEELGGAVGATRAAVDSGWIPYAQQIGQTGKIVKPALYLALGISGAIQHKVGMQTAETIVAVNRDPDAPIAAFADLVVIGDLFEVGPAFLAALRERAG
ncbi:MAG TPA: electron transfer flavoprotein subunit alpha/FixB family protein [Candidatus Limnocylindrales bacterium]|nr:electron transfer flavoprotein subunit alpha/FixB family protein [Candidatus Limnocylindrales bacterium]